MRLFRHFLVNATPLLRVEIQEVEKERVSGFPPRVLRPMSIEPFDLNIDGHLSPCRTAKATHLAKLAAQLTIGALQQGGGADEFASHPIERRVSNGLLKIALQGRHGFRGSRSPQLGKGRQTLLRFLGTLGLINGTSLLYELLPRFLVGLPFEFLPTLVRHIAQFVKNAALFEHRASIHPGDGLASLATAIADHCLQPVFRTQTPFP